MQVRGHKPKPKYLIILEIESHIKELKKTKCKGYYKETIIQSIEYWENQLLKVKAVK